MNLDKHMKVIYDCYSNWNGMSPTGFASVLTYSLGGANKCLSDDDCDERLIKLSMHRPDPMTDDFKMNKFCKVKEICKTYVSDNLGQHPVSFSKGLAELLYEKQQLSKTQLPSFRPDSSQPDNPVAYANEGGEDISTQVLVRPL